MHNKQQLFVNLNFAIRLFPVLGAVSLSFGCLFLNVEVVILESQDADSAVLQPNEGGGATSVPRIRSFV